MRTGYPSHAPCAIARMTSCVENATRGHRMPRAAASRHDVDTRVLRRSRNTPSKIMESSPLQLINPADPRAARIAEALSSDPSDPRPLADICKLAGASKRTIERLFQSETNMSLGGWRQQLRLLHSLRLLAAANRSHAWHSIRATARPARSSRCSGKRSARRRAAISRLTQKTPGSNRSL